jgi:hypothetical protein
MALSIGTITVDSGTPGNPGVLTSSDHNQNTGADGHLYVLINTIEAVPAPNSVTYGGNALTLEDTGGPMSDYSGITYRLYSLDSPSTGNNDLVITYNTFSVYNEVEYIIISTTGSDGAGGKLFLDNITSAPYDVSGTISGVSSGSTIFLAATGLLSNLAGSTLTIDGTDYTWSEDRSNAMIIGEYKENVSSGSVALSSGTSGNSSIGGYAFEITEAGGAPVTTRRIIIM